MESYVNISDNRTESIANGSGQEIFNIDLSAFGSGQTVSIELFVIMISQSQTSSLYVRNSQTLVVGDTIQGQDTGGDSKWSYNQSTSGCTHSLTYEYDQGGSIIRVKATNSTGSTDSVNFFYSAYITYE